MMLAAGALGLAPGRSPAPFSGRPEKAPDASSPAARAPEPLRDLGRTHKVRLVYFVPADREPARAWRDKITVLATFVADLYRRDLCAHGCATRGLDFEFDDAGRPVVHLVRGACPAAHYNGDPDFTFMRQWRTVLPEVEAALGPRAANLHLIFAETYDDGPTRFEWRGGVALGCQVTACGGAGLFSAWILRDAFCAATVAEQLRLLADEAPVRGRTALGHGRPNSPRFEFIEDGFGAVAHELGHAFGLPHDHRRDGRYVMGNGFRNLRRNFLEAAPAEPVGFSRENARLLAHSRFLAEKPDLEDTTRPVVRLDEPGGPLAAGATEIPLAGRATDDRGLAAAVYFVREMDSVVAGADLMRRVGAGVRRGGSEPVPSAAEAHPPRNSGKALANAVGTEPHRAKHTAPFREADLSATLAVKPLKAGRCHVRVLVIDRGGNIGSAEVAYEVSQ